MEYFLASVQNNTITERLKLSIQFIDIVINNSPNVSRTSVILYLAPEHHQKHNNIDVFTKINNTKIMQSNKVFLVCLDGATFTSISRLNSVLVTY